MCVSSSLSADAPCPFHKMWVITLKRGKLGDFWRRERAYLSGNIDDPVKCARGAELGLVLESFDQIFRVAHELICIDARPLHVPVSVEKDFYLVVALQQQQKDRVESTHCENWQLCRPYALCTAESYYFLIFWAKNCRLLVKNIHLVLVI